MHLLATCEAVHATSSSPRWSTLPRRRAGIEKKSCVLACVGITLAKVRKNPESEGVLPLLPFQPSGVAAGVAVVLGCTGSRVTPSSTGNKLHLSFCRNAFLLPLLGRVPAGCQGEQRTTTRRRQVATVTITLQRGRTLVPSTKQLITV